MTKASKGGAWERDLCKIFSEWINGSIKPYVFWRGRGSGAMFSMDNSLGDAFSGDIYCVREEGKFLTSLFSLEAKNGYPKASIDLHLKDNKNDTLRDFWDQTCDDADKAEKLPLLIYKKKGFPNPWIGWCDKTNDKLNKYFEGKKMVHMCYGDDRPDIYLYNFKEFLELINPDIIKKEFGIE